MLKIWEEKVKIPTYETGEMNKNPMFLEKRVYQGSTGKVYPYPVVDKIYDEKVDKEYMVVFLENDYLRIEVIPELGGRIYRAFDKTNEYDFVYYNRVIKPALVGLAGPWISGGIEFNWPQHHRPNTFGRVSYLLESAEDKVTVRLGEYDRINGTRMTMGVSLNTESAYVEISAELYNPTNEGQTFLWWANPAVAVHDETKSIFPPDVTAVMDHGKRGVSRFPIATGEYYKMDYSAGVDISRYKNIPVPTSYMAYKSDYDFVGGYDFRKGAGLLHVANRHISPGKKQWTWGSGEFGRAWDDNLTDEDGPYIELMTGVFTDNQPDFTWLAPHSGKNFTQYFMPYKSVGEVKNATRDVVVGLETADGRAVITVYASKVIKNASVTLEKKGGEIVYFREVDLSPLSAFKDEAEVGDAADWELVLSVTGNGFLPVKYAPKAPALEKIPDPAKAIAANPTGVRDNESLYLAGLHLEQYRHATYRPEDYYEEGLRRDASDIRINNALGKMKLRSGDFEGALANFNAALTTLSRHNANPPSGEFSFNKGLALEFLGQEDEAFAAYHKAVWSDDFRSSGYLRLALILSRKGKTAEALECARESVYANFKNFKARNVLTSLLRKSGDLESARETARQTLAFDSLDFAALRELAHMGGAADYKKVLRGDPHNYIILARHYADLGFYGDSLAVLDEYLGGAARPYAMTLYLRAWVKAKSGEDAAADWQRAANADGSYCFPNTAEDYAVLLCAVSHNENDAMARYYAGCFLYDKRRHGDAFAAWSAAAELAPEFPPVWRNLALYYANKRGDYVQARKALERAFSLNESDSRVFYELCELYKKIKLPNAEIRAIMEKYRNLVGERDDLTLIYLETLNAAGEFERAIEILTTRKFHPWEGGEGKAPARHKEARIGLAKRLLRKGEFERAAAELKMALSFLPNFGEGKIKGYRDNDVYFYLGLTAESAGGKGGKGGKGGEGGEGGVPPSEYYEKAAEGDYEPNGAMYYNDQPPHVIYYQGLALYKLGRVGAAKSKFNKLIAFGEKHLFESQTMDYFAVSLPDFLVFESDLDEKNREHCLEMIELGKKGLREIG